MSVIQRTLTGPIAPVEIERRPWLFKCDKPHCFIQLTAPSEAAANALESTHSCRAAGGTSIYHWSVTVTLVEQVWAKLDADMLSLKQPEANTDYKALKARLRAFAEVLAIFMAPHFTTADEIAREANRRYENRGDSTYETAGLKSRRFEGPPVAKKAPQTTKTAAEIHAESLPQSKVDNIMTFFNAGFPLETIAAGNDLPVSVIRIVVNR